MKPKILFLHQSWRGFEQRDFEILKKNFIIQEILVYKNFLYKSFAAITLLRQVDIVFCWFAYRSALPALLFAKLFKKKIIVVAGGWECANAPEINYGAFRKGFRFLPTRIITQYIISLADSIVAISEYNKKEIVANCGIPPEEIKVIYHGIPSCSCRKDNEDKKEDVVLTVGNILESNLTRKGLLVFIKAAAMLPKVQFILAGRIEKRLSKYIHSIVPVNVQVTDFVSDETLHALYKRAKVYAQLSYHEQFGCALAEAMIYACVPVVTDKASLPEVVGQTGYYVPYGDVEKTVEGITRALKDAQKGEMARQRIIELFSLQKREEALVNLINGMFL